MPESSKKLLIVWVYHEAVGHFVEAMEVAANYKAANPHLQIDILVNDKTTWQLGKYCNWICNCYGVNIDDVNRSKHLAKSISTIPKEYEYVIFPKRLKYTPDDHPEAMLSCIRILQSVFKGKVWSGYNESPVKDKNGLEQNLHSLAIMEFSREATSYANKMASGSPLISVMLKGASRENIWPSLQSWKIILNNIKQKYPKATFLITGIYDVHITRPEKLEQAKRSINRFINSIPGAINCYNVGLEKQLAIIQKSDVFISPHTGFAFLSAWVGTPWLSLSGSRWPDYRLGCIPFYSVLPKCNAFPCAGEMKKSCQLRIKLRQRVKCMGTLLRQNKNEITKGLKFLLDTNSTFKQSVVEYEKLALAKRVNVEKIKRMSKLNKHRTSKLI